MREWKHNDCHAQSHDPSCHACRIIELEAALEKAEGKAIRLQGQIDGLKNTYALCGGCGHRNTYDKWDLTTTTLEAENIKLQRQIDRVRKVFNDTNDADDFGWAMFDILDNDGKFIEGKD